MNTDNQMNPSVSMNPEAIASRRRQRYTAEKERYDELSIAYRQDLEYFTKSYSPKKTTYKFSGAAFIVMTILFSGLLFGAAGLLFSLDTETMINNISTTLQGIADPTGNGVLFIILLALSAAVNMIFTLLFALPAGLVQALGSVPHGKIAVPVAVIILYLLALRIFAVTKKRDALVNQEAKAKAEKELAEQAERLRVQEQNMQEAKKSLDDFLNSQLYKNSQR